MRRLSAASPSIGTIFRTRNVADSSTSRPSGRGMKYDIDNLIEFDLMTFTIANIEEARIRGLEAVYIGSASAWRWRTGFVFMDPENRTTRDDLARRARRSFTGSLTRAVGEHVFGLDILMSGERKDSPFSDLVNAGFVLANLTAQVRLGDEWTLGARLENILDSQYQTAAGFNAADRGLYVEIQYSATR